MRSFLPASLSSWTRSRASSSNYSYRQLLAPQAAVGYRYNATTTTASSNPAGQRSEGVTGGPGGKRRSSQQNLSVVDVIARANRKIAHHHHSGEDARGQQQESPQRQQQQPQQQQHHHRPHHSVVPVHKTFKRANFNRNNKNKAEQRKQAGAAAATLNNDEDSWLDAGSSSSSSSDIAAESNNNSGGARPNRQIVRVAGVHKVCHLLRHRNLLKEFRQYRRQRRLFVFVGSDAVARLSSEKKEENTAATTETSSNGQESYQPASDIDGIADESSRSKSQSRHNGEDDSAWMKKVIWPGRDFQRFVFDNPFASSGVKAAVRLSAVWNLPVTLAPSMKALELLCRSRKHEGLVLQVDARPITMRTTINGNTAAEIEEKAKWVARLTNGNTEAQQSPSEGEKADEDDESENDGGESSIVRSGGSRKIPKSFLPPAWSLHAVGIKEQAVATSAGKTAAYYGASRIFLSAGCPWDCFYGHVENIPVFGASGRPADFIEKSRAAHPGALFVGFGAPVRRSLETEEGDDGSAAEHANTSSSTSITDDADKAVSAEDSKAELEKFQRLVASPKQQQPLLPLNAQGWPHRVIVVVGSGPGGALAAPLLRQCSAVLRVDPHDPLGYGFRVRVVPADVTLPAPVPSAEVYSEECGDVTATTQLLSEHGVGCGPAEAVAMVAPMVNRLISQGL